MSTPRDLHALRAGTLYHAAPSSPIATADATNESTAVALATAIRAYLASHFADATAHVAADVTTTLPDDLIYPHNLRVRIRALEGALEDHCRNEACHVCPDRVNSADPRVPQTPVETLEIRTINRLKARINVHVANAPEEE
jgi:mRNA-degrading endonuclease toxin of MazEF toxin-antitoxin module